MPSTISMMPRFMPCSSSPAPASISSRKKSVMDRTAVSDCPTPTVSTRTLRNPAASHSRMVSRVRRATPPRWPRDGRRPDEGALLHGQPLHARLVAEDAAARNRAGRIDAQHRDVFAAVAHQVHAERVDEGALAHAGHARDADAPRLARVRQHRVEQPRRQFAIRRQVAFDQRDGAGERPCGPRPGRRLCSCSSGSRLRWALDADARRRSRTQHRVAGSSARTIGITVPGPKTSVTPAAIQAS